MGESLSVRKRSALGVKRQAHSEYTSIYTEKIGLVKPKKREPIVSKLLFSVD